MDADTGPRAGRSQNICWAFWISLLLYSLLIVARRTFLTLNSTAAIWPAAGIMAVGFLLSPRKYWKWLIAIAVVENVIANSLFGFSPRTLVSIPESMLLAYLIRRFCPRSLNFAEPRTLLLFLVTALFPACFFSALFVYLLPGKGVASTEALHWFIGHSLGAAIAVPSMMTLLRQRRYAVFRRPAWEMIAVCGLMLVYVTILFTSAQPVLALLVFPTAMFIAFRFGPVGASVVSVLMMCVALGHIYAGIPGPRPTSFQHLQWVQCFVAVVFLTGLPAAGALASLRRTRRLLAQRTQTARLARSRADSAALAKSQFLANMSHEIRTPLNGVIGLADALSRTPLRPDQREMLAMIQNSGQALNGILSDVLDLARADAGGLKLAVEPFEPAEAINAASYLFESIASAKGVDFEVRLDMAHTGPALGDPLRIRQVVSNLISNAVKFTAAGKVTVCATLRPSGPNGMGELMVSVTDTGVGFDEEVRARLFSRFEQADPTIPRRFGGTGLGLAISRELAELMGGEIDCSSTPGEGATFVFRAPLPLLDAAARGDTPAPLPSEAPGSETRLKVLLAEDHPINQRVIQIILADSTDLTIVGDGQAAVEACESQAFDLILMDTQMPVMDGLTAIRVIRQWEAREGRAPTPIISLTADAMPHQVHAALAAGADRHLAKPITAESLFVSMNEALDLKAA